MRAGEGAAPPYWLTGARRGRAAGGSVEDENEAADDDGPDGLCEAERDDDEDDDPRAPLDVGLGEGRGTAAGPPGPGGVDAARAGASDGGPAAPTAVLAIGCCVPSSARGALAVRARAAGAPPIERAALGAPPPAAVDPASTRPLESGPALAPAAPVAPPGDALMCGAAMAKEEGEGGWAEGRERPTRCDWSAGPRDRTGAAAG